MPVKVPDNWFSTGIWAADGPLRMTSATCTQCGTRFKTFETFRAHRRADACHDLAAQKSDTQPDWEQGIMSQGDREALDSLLAALPDPDVLVAALSEVETLS